VIRRLLAALACAALLAVVTPGGALAGDDGAAERALGRRSFDEAEQHFKKGQFQAALELYEEGYRLTRLPGFLINIAHCYRLTGEARRARATYRKFLIVEPSSPHKAEIEEIIRGLDRAIGRQGGEAAAAAEARKPRVPSTRWWLWSALAASVVGSTVANMALAEADQQQ
jgi:hypothetical protein